MSGTQIFVLALVLGLGALVFMLAALRSRTPASAEMSLGEVFSVKISLSNADRENAVQAVGAAALKRGQSSTEASVHARERISSLEKARVVRTLWVDDNPDNNVFETLALGHLGVQVTSAASNAAARTFLSAVDFDLVITDLNRGSDPDDGRVLIKELHANQPTLPCIVYTSSASAKAEDLVMQGATAVEDEPDALLSAVMAAIGH